jgi:hypothetical protein
LENEVTVHSSAFSTDNFQMENESTKEILYKYNNNLPEKLKLVSPADFRKPTFWR